jgi:hypothetical protein
MIQTCMLHNNNTCGKRQTIEKNTKNMSKIIISYAYEWNTKSDNLAFIYEIIEKIIKEIKISYPFIDITFRCLSGKDGNIYCDICRQIQETNIFICDISKNNPNVNFELGLAIASGARIFMIRSKHYKKPQKILSDLTGNLEYRFSRRNGNLKFDTDFAKSVKEKINAIISHRMDEIPVKIVNSNPKPT